MEFEEEEELVPPERPQRITRNMKSGDMLKLQRETSNDVEGDLVRSPSPCHPPLFPLPRDRDLSP